LEQQGQNEHREATPFHRDWSARQAS
jgi:hypothetical protein